MWDNTLVKFGRAPRRHQSDEESLGAKQGEDVPRFTSNAEKEGRKSSSSSLKDNDPRRPGKDERDGANQANGNTGSEPRQDIKNIRKAGYHGEAWEETERTPGSRQGQESENHREDHDDKDQETQQRSDDTKTQRKEDDQELEHKKDKETVTMTRLVTLKRMIPGRRPATMEVGSEKAEVIASIAAAL